MHVPIPANIATVNALFDARIQTEDEMKAFMANERAGQPADADCANSEQAGKARAGTRIFDALFRDYTRKQWGVGAEALDASVLRRILRMLRIRSVPIIVRPDGGQSAPT